MNDKMDNLQISELAKRRRKLIEIEQSVFKSRTHTTIQILILLAENDFKAKLSTIYEHAQATDASVRQHLRALEKLKFVIQVQDNADGRAKFIQMTEYGKKQLASYTASLSDIIPIASR
jgi:DNA-binding MarR family transcriptional regulator